MDLVYIDELGCIDLVQRCLDGFDLKHAIGNNFAFEFG